MNIIKIFKESFKEVKKTRPIILCGFLLAISIILGRFAIKIEGLTIITASFVANSIAGMLFGPIFSSILAASTDVLNHFIAPKGEYFFGWTLDAFLAGIIYGVFLYDKSYDINNKKQLLIRIILAKVIISIFINLGLGTLWLSMLRGKSYLALLLPRIIKEIILIPIHSLILFYILPVVNKFKKNMNL